MERREPTGGPKEAKRSVATIVRYLLNAGQQHKTKSIQVLMNLMDFVSS